MSDQEKANAEGVAEFDVVSETETMSKDERRIAEWTKAKESVPTEESIFKMKEKIERAESALEKANREYQEAVVRRALVFGWRNVADEEDVTTRRLHMWQKEHLPNEDDLSDVPTKVIPREKARVEALEAEVQRQKQKAEESERRTERFRTLLKDWKEQ